LRSARPRASSSSSIKSKTFGFDIDAPAGAPDLARVEVDLDVGEAVTAGCGQTSACFRFGHPVDADTPFYSLGRSAGLRAGHPAVDNGGARQL
jgi:hypothetical protein